MIQMPYTVVLRRPDYMAGQCETVVVVVSVPFDCALPVAQTHELAVGAAQVQAFTADQDNGSESPDDYALIVLFAGHQPPLQFGD